MNFEVLRLSIIFLFLTLSVLGQTSERERFDPCSARVVENSSVRTPARVYRQTFWRKSAEYFNLLGSEFETRYQNVLQNPSRHSPPLFIDVGSGMSLTGLEWGTRGGRAVGISAHDFWHEFDTLAEVPSGELSIFSLREEFRLERIGSLDAISFREAAKFFDITFTGKVPKKERRWGRIRFGYRPDVEQLLPHLHRVAKEITRRRKLVEDSGRFKIEIGLAEDILPLYSRQADLVADVYGAFFYSLDRRNVIERVYESLSETGVAFLFYGDCLNTKYGGPSDVVRDGDHSIEFLSFLTQTYPNIFSEVDGNGQGFSYRVLRVQRDAQVKSLTLPLRLARENVQYVSSNDGFSFASKVQYHLLTE